MLGAVVGAWAGALSAGAEDVAGAGVEDSAEADGLAGVEAALADRCVDGVDELTAELDEGVEDGELDVAADLPGIASA